MEHIESNPTKNATNSSTKAQHLHIRASARDKRTLARAARLKKLSVSQFLLQLALPVAEEIIENEAPESEMAEVQTVFALDEEAWTEFNRLLDAPTRDIEELPALKALLASKPVWEA